MEKIVVRCSNVVKTKDDRDKRCKAFVAEIDEYKITTSCRKCGTEYVISRGPIGDLRVEGFPKKKRLIQNTETK